MNGQEINYYSHDEIDITKVNQSPKTLKLKRNSLNDNKSFIDPNHVNYKLPTEQFCIVVLSLLIAMAMASLDITIVASALPVITTEFNSHDNYTWVIVAYLLANTSLQPTCGKLADIFSRRSVMVCGLSVFLISSVICGVSTNFYMLTISRAFQGAGSGCLCSMANIICSDIVSVKERGTYLGLLNSSFSLALAVGPLVGGFFTDIISWRWAFYINVPLCLISILGISLYAKIPSSKGSLIEKIKRIDFIGTFFLIVTVVCLLLALNWAGSTYEWSSPIIVGLFIASVVLLFCFIIIEYKIAREPIIPIRLFRKRNLNLCVSISFLSGLIFVTFNNTFSMLYQDGRGFSAMMSGLRIAPSFITIAIASTGCGWLVQKYGHIKEFTMIGSFLLIISCYSLSIIGEETPFIEELIIFLFYGFCISIPLQFSLVISQLSAPIKLNAISTSVTLFFRMIGGVIGVAIFGMIIKNKFIINYKNAYPEIHHVSVNDLQKLENGPHYYVKAINFSYCATFLPAAVIIFILSIFLRRLKYITKIRKSSRNPQDEIIPVVSEEEINI